MLVDDQVVLSGVGPDVAHETGYGRHDDQSEQHRRRTHVDPLGRIYLCRLELLSQPHDRQRGHPQDHQRKHQTGRWSSVGEQLQPLLVAVAETRLGDPIRRGRVGRGPHNRQEQHPPEEIVFDAPVGLPHLAPVYPSDSITLLQSVARIPDPGDRRNDHRIELQPDDHGSQENDRREGEDSPPRSIHVAVGIDQRHGERLMRHREDQGGRHQPFDARRVA